MAEVEGTQQESGMSNAEQMSNLDEKTKVERHSPEHTANQVLHAAEMTARRAQDRGHIRTSRSKDLYGTEIDTTFEATEEDGATIVKTKRKPATGEAGAVGTEVTYDTLAKGPGSDYVESYLEKAVTTGDNETDPSTSRVFVRADSETGDGTEVTTVEGSIHDPDWKGAALGNKQTRKAAANILGETRAAMADREAKIDKDLDDVLSK